MAGIITAYIMGWIVTIAIAILFNAEGPFVLWAFFNLLGLIALAVYGLVVMAVGRR